MFSQDDIQKQILNWSHRLQKLKEKQALLGYAGDPSLEIEIEDIQTRLTELQTELSRLGDPLNVSPSPEVPRVAGLGQMGHDSFMSPATSGGSTPGGFVNTFM